MPTSSKPDIAKLAFAFSCLLLVFGAGFSVRHFEMLPYRILRSGVAAVRQVFAERSTLTGVRPQELTQPARRVGKGITVNKAGQTQPGLTFITSFFDSGNEMRLVRLDGSVVHRWPVKFFEIFPNRDHVDKADLPQSEWNLDVHGSLALPDGSIVFNFEGLGSVKLDRCGTVQWTLPRITHHSIERSQDGGFWIPSGTLLKKDSPFPALTPPYFNEKILKVSAEGKVLRELSVLQILFKNHMEAHLFTNGLYGIKLASNDLTHLNDVEELDSSMASAFPQFRAGDLLVSLRNLNMVMVVDPLTEKVKWHQVGPWIKQHDPDFLASGKIAVLANNDDGSPTGTILGGSKIIETNPATGENTVRYGDGPNQNWYSFRRGKIQYLPNGDILIADSESGRVVEINPAGEIVWEFINRYDDKFVAVIRGATRYPEDYFTVKDWSCNVLRSNNPAQGEK